MMRLFLILAVMAGMLPTRSFAQNCDQAYRSVIENGEVKFLSRAISACADKSDRLNNLAFWLEQRGFATAAVKLYRRALAAPDATIIPYAGLGDVLLSQGKTKAAIDAFAIFLKGLETEIKRGDNRNVAEYRKPYRDKLKKALIAIGRGAEDINAIIAAAVMPAPVITRMLTTKPKQTRGINVAYRDRPFIDIPIRFEFDSNRLTSNARAQLSEIAASLNNPMLKKIKILIEGHTDHVGEADYNLALSLRRAESVRQNLIQQHRFEKLRFVVKGFGESRPVASNETETGQAINRRVTFVNLGKINK